jgi:hypothetical protein
MSKYGKLADGLNVDGEKPLPYHFDMLPNQPTLFCLPATEDNKPFMNESLRRAAVRRARRVKVTNADTVKASREEDKEIIANFCVRSWSMKIDSNDVEFSADECMEFFAALPDWVFDDFRVWLTDPTNFVKVAVDGTALGER